MIFLHMKPFLYPASGVRATGQSPLRLISNKVAATNTTF